LIVTTLLPLWDRIALTVMGILREHRRPLYRNLELCVGETASATLNALIKSKAARRGQGILRPRLAHTWGRRALGSSPASVAPGPSCSGDEA